METTETTFRHMLNCHLSKTESLVFLEIRRDAKDNGEAFIDQPGIRKALNLSMATTSNAIKQLHKKGAIERTSKNRAVLKF